MDDPLLSRDDNDDLDVQDICKDGALLVIPASIIGVVLLAVSIPFQAGLLIWGEVQDRAR